LIVDICSHCIYICVKVNPLMYVPSLPTCPHFNEVPKQPIRPILLSSLLTISVSSVSYDDLSDQVDSLKIYLPPSIPYRRSSSAAIVVQMDVSTTIHGFHRAVVAGFVPIYRHHLCRFHVSQINCFRVVNDYKKIQFNI